MLDPTLLDSTLLNPTLLIGPHGLNTEMVVTVVNTMIDTADMATICAAVPPGGVPSGSVEIISSTPSRSRRRRPGTLMLRLAQQAQRAPQIGKGLLVVVDQP